MNNIGRNYKLNKVSKERKNDAPISGYDGNYELTQLLDLKRSTTKDKGWIKDASELSEDDLFDFIGAKVLKKPESASGTPKKDGLPGPVVAAKNPTN